MNKVCKKHGETEFLKPDAQGKSYCKLCWEEELRKLGKAPPAQVKHLDLGLSMASQIVADVKERISIK